MSRLIEGFATVSVYQLKRDIMALLILVMPNWGKTLWFNSKKTLINDWKLNKISSLDLQ